MKKNILFVLLLVSSASFAQHFELGVKAGANISNFYGSDNASQLKANSYVGFHGGGFVSLFMGKIFAIQPEVLLSTQGAKVDDISGNKKDYQLTYINIPVMLKLRSPGGFYVEAGPQIGFNVDSKVEGTGEDFAKSTDLSIAGGLGYHSPVGLGLGARYTAGLSKLGDFDVSNPGNPNWKNGVIQVSLFYTLFNNHRR